MEKDLYWFNGIESEMNSSKNSYLLNTNDKNIGYKVASDIADYIINENDLKPYDELVLCSLDRKNDKLIFDNANYFQSMPQVYKLKEPSEYVISYDGEHEVIKLHEIIRYWKPDLLNSINGTNEVFNKLIIIENSLANLNAIPNEVIHELLAILELGPQRNIRIILINMEDKNENFDLRGSVELYFFYEINLKLIHDEDREIVKINGNLSDKPAYYFNPYIHN